MAVEYRKLVDKDLDIFIEMRILQLQEEGAEATFDFFGKADSVFEEPF